MKFVLLFLFVFSSAYAIAAELPELEIPKKIDFRLFYPVPQLKSSVKKSSRIAAGLDLNYQFNVTKYFGVQFTLLTWIVPVRVQNDKARFIQVGVLGGGFWSPLPYSYFDPRLHMSAGIGAEDVGSLQPMRAVYPVKVSSSLNIYRTNQRFEDSDLALALIGSCAREYKSQPIATGWYWDLGLALRGSF